MSPDQAHSGGAHGGAHNGAHGSPPDTGVPALPNSSVNESMPTKRPNGSATSAPKGLPEWPPMLIYLCHAALEHPALLRELEDTFRQRQTLFAESTRGRGGGSSRPRARAFAARMLASATRPLVTAPPPTPESSVDSGSHQPPSRRLSAEAASEASSALRAGGLSRAAPSSARDSSGRDTASAAANSLQKLGSQRPSQRFLPSRLLSKAPSKANHLAEAMHESERASSRHPSEGVIDAHLLPRLITTYSTAVAFSHYIANCPERLKQLDIFKHTFSKFPQAGVLRRAAAAAVARQALFVRLDRPPAHLDGFLGLGAITPSAGVASPPSSATPRARAFAEKSLGRKRAQKLQVRVCTMLQTSGGGRPSSSNRNSEEEERRRRSSESFDAR